MILFSCDEVGYIVAKCSNKNEIDEKKFSKYKGKKDYKSYKDKSKKSYYIVNDSNSEEDEIVVVKDNFENEENGNIALISRVSKMKLG